MKILRIWLGLLTENDVGNVTLIEVLTCLRERMRPAICNRCLNRSKRWAEKNRKREEEEA